VQITSPAGGAAFAPGSTIPVSFTATDNVSVSNAEGLSDLNGDGSIDEATEVFPAVPAGGVPIVRYLLNLRGNALITGAFDPMGSRTTAFDIENHLLSLMPP
jgi:hypothetical protein